MIDKSALSLEVNELHANLCGALADPRRILMLYIIAEENLNVSQLAEAIHISQPAASRHLNILRERGMITAQRDGQSVVYMLADARIIEALDLLRAVLADNLKRRGALAETAIEQQT